MEALAIDFDRRAELCADAMRDASNLSRRYEAMGLRNAWTGAAEAIRMAFAAPDRGTLINAAASAGAAVVDAHAFAVRVRSNPKATVADYERARVALVGATTRKEEADAALDAVGRYGPTLLVTL